MKWVKAFTSRTQPLGQNGTGLVTLTVTPSDQRWVVPKRAGELAAEVVGAATLVVVAVEEGCAAAAVLAVIVGPEHPLSTTRAAHAAAQPTDFTGRRYRCAAGTPNPHLTIQRLRSFEGGRWLGGGSANRRRLHQPLAQPDGVVFAEAVAREVGERAAVRVQAVEYGLDGRGRRCGHQRIDLG